MKAVVIEQAAIVTPLGTLAETTADLIDGATAVTAGPCFGVPVAFAPFQDLRFRDLAFSASWLGSRIDLSGLDPVSTVFIFCAAKGDMRAIEEKIFHGAVTTAVSPLLDRQAETVCRLLSFSPARICAVSNACASGAAGVETAAELLNAGRFAHAVLFGLDVLLRFTATGFFSLGALSPTGARPFDARRDGLTMGEGAAIMVLSYRDAYEGDIVVSGAGSSNDANHRTGPSRTGEGLLRAAHAALANAGLAPASIGAVKCHGTATLYNDAMEAKALYSLFGRHCPPCASFKGAMGHLSGVSSLVETAIAAECLIRRILPPTAGYEHHGVDEPLSLATQPQPIEQPVILCLAAGFSGLNTALVLKEQT